MVKIVNKEKGDFWKAVLAEFIDKGIFSYSVISVSRYYVRGKNQSALNNKGFRLCEYGYK